MNYIHHQDIVLDAQGRPVAGALVTVAGYPSGTATIYQDEGTTEISGTSTNTNGRYGFYAAPGRYSITISAAGIGTIQVEDIALNDATYTEDFTAIETFDADWAEADASAYGACAYKRDADGTVRLRGKVTRATGTSTAPETVLTLPADVRPTKIQELVAAGLQGSDYVAVPVQIGTGGAVYIMADGIGSLFLHGITFAPSSIA